MNEALQYRDDNTLCVVAATDHRYAHYILPYITSTLIANPRAIVEVFIDEGSSRVIQKDLDTFGNIANGVMALNVLFPGQALVKPVDMDGVSPSIYRFITEPTHKTSHVYMGDIDILVMSKIMPGHLAKMEQFGTRYSNIVRRPFELRKLSGLHFTEYDFHYPVDIPEDVDLTSTRWGLDEELLMQIVSRKQEPNVEFNYRPLHGLHLSPHGWPYHRTRGWDLTPDVNKSSYMFLCNNDVWKEMTPYFGRKYGVIQSILDVAIEASHVFSKDELAQMFVLSGHG